MCTSEPEKAHGNQVLPVLLVCSHFIPSNEQPVEDEDVFIHCIYLKTIFILLLGLVNRSSIDGHYKRQYSQMDGVHSCTEVICPLLLYKFFCRINENYYYLTVIYSTYY